MNSDKRYIEKLTEGRALESRREKLAQYHAVCYAGQDMHILTSRCSRRGGPDLFARTNLGSPSGRTALPATPERHGSFVQRSPKVHGILVRKIRCYPPPPKKAQNDEKLYKISRDSSFGGVGGERNFMAKQFVDIRAFLIHAFAGRSSLIERTCGCTQGPEIQDKNNIEVAKRGQKLVWGVGTQ